MKNDEILIYITKEEIPIIFKKCIEGVKRHWNWNITFDNGYIMGGYRCVIYNDNLYKKPKLLKLLSDINNITKITYNRSYNKSIRYEIKS